MSALHDKLATIQRDLKAPKGQFNKFGGYKYRSCEDILEAVKPLLNGLVLTIHDDIQAVGDRIYIKATATITDGENSLSVSAFAREAETKKGMDDSQITGTASSYARKYALNGLFLIDDTKDADTGDNKHDSELRDALANINNADSMQALEATFKAAWTGFTDSQSRQALTRAKDKRKAELS